MTTDVTTVARNGMIGGACSVAGMALASSAMSHPETAAIIATGAAGYAVLSSETVQTNVRGAVREIGGFVREGVGEPHNEDNRYNAAGLLGNAALVTGIAASMASGNPAFAYAGCAVATGGQLVRGGVHNRMCTIL